MFQIYENNMQCSKISYMSLFAGDTKSIKVVKSLDDCWELLGDIDKSRGKGLFHHRLKGQGDGR